MYVAYLLLGADLGDKLETFAKVKQLLALRVGGVIAESSVYESQAWGFESDSLFFNQVLKVDTSLSPQELLDTILQVEAELGRTRSGNGYESRVVDIDILFYDKLILNTPTLTVPHPLMQERMFALAPLCELEPEYVHPVLHKTLCELKASCPDKSIVRKRIADIG